ncbi:MAG TPA: 4-alpha-glucanotransferase [Mycobacteriales bacterium]|nr:4-alpha-glucanotransferase [Mycobacteriales bacterium]
MTASQTRRELRRLARLRGIQLSYTAHDGKSVRASDDTLVAVLGALGHPVPNAAAIHDQLQLAESEPEQAVAVPVERAARGDRAAARRALGISAPLYAIRGSDDWGVGSFRDLTAFADLAAAWGAQLIGTLPLFATSTESPIDPSPYLPVSRLFWNELYVDVTNAAELAGCDAPAAMRPGPPVRQAAEADYEVVADAKRRALDECATAMQSATGHRREAYERFLTEQPDIDAYADFRAKGDERSARYHRFVQYAAATQLAEAAEHGDRIGVGLYLDLPVGVHPEGFDTWANPDLFADAQVGAPPDALAAGGQAWGFPPLHPQRLRATGYRYFIDTLRVALRYARAVRLDHILGLQRLYWIPAGLDATAGAYVRYRHDELLAIVADEARRAGVTVIGEDLGTVSPTIRRGMDDYGILHTFVSRFEASPDNPLPQPRQPAAASLGSHDLPRFATFWREPEQQELVSAVGVTDPADALRVCLASLAGGPATYVIADLADLEGETEPDNRPGTGPEAGNWRRRLPRPLEAIAADEDLHELMTGLAAARGRTATKGTPR